MNFPEEPVPIILNGLLGFTEKVISFSISFVPICNDTFLKRLYFSCFLMLRYHMNIN